MPAIPRKPDSERIISFLKELEQQDWVRRSERSKWPRYVFHFAPIENAVRILDDNELRCRNLLEDSGSTFRDAASPEIIATTDHDVKNFVRLYFRPRTPTQFHNEGIRPRDKLTSLNAHCPVPIFFLFKSADILTRLDCHFTDGNPARRRAIYGNDTTFLKNLPFKKIYHTGSLGPDSPEKDAIIFHRNAEVIIPERLDLSALSLLACRSPAEKDTFLNLLPEAVRKKYQNRIQVAPVQLHEKKWTFVEQVTLDQEYIVVRFSPDTLTPGPFLAQFELYNLETGKSDIQQIRNFNVRAEPNPFGIELTLRPSHYLFRITLDGNLAYQNTFQADITG